MCKNFKINAVSFLKSVLKIMIYSIIFILAFVGLVSIILLVFGYRPIQYDAALFDWEAISSMSAFVAAVATTLYLIATIMILRENQKTNKLNQEQYDDLSQPKIIADFCVERDSELRLVVRNEGRTTASNVKVKINYLDEWLKLHDSKEKKSYYYYTCKDLIDNQFTLVTNKEKYFCIGDIHVNNLLKNDVRIDIDFVDNKQQRHTTSFIHNISLYEFLNGDSNDPIQELNKNISYLADMLNKPNF